MNNCWANRDLKIQSWTLQSLSKLMWLCIILWDKNDCALCSTVWFLCLNAYCIQAFYYNSINTLFANIGRTLNVSQLCSLSLPVSRSLSSFYSAVQTNAPSFFYSMQHWKLIQSTYQSLPVVCRLLLSTHFLHKLSFRLIWNELKSQQCPSCLRQCQQWKSVCV